jgi:hypothetical protein
LKKKIILTLLIWNDPNAMSCQSVIQLSVPGLVVLLYDAGLLKEMRLWKTKLNNLETVLFAGET